MFATKPRPIKMSLKRYEFRCPTCEAHYLKITLDATICLNPNCKKSFMQLVAVLEIAENAGIFTGYPVRTTIDKVLDKKE
jgi:hypothetical protein